MEELPKDWTWDRLLEAVKKRHAPIKKFLQSGIAPRLQRIDSDIAEDVMLSMMKRNILVLPIHDSFIVRSGFHLALIDEMQRAFREKMKSDIDLKMVLSFWDKQPGQKNANSTFEQFDAILDKKRRLEEGPYAGYYQRRRDFVARKNRAYFGQFEFL
jgi:hypothetical protein